ncbi:MerR family transcriptional regulator [Streptomyces iranensis]|uniref:DNA-binding transcriptional MerR regulator n=1 Tax=Streptomyces iranensis TaxID=576784 RepID=A0A060ZKF9_9ACTN|nr:MerR family transcriptional regulator [Streptomyces iranensis]MBP2060771.1 DNA-binding transcriptional MerR regulator [Streptomyces iranensis]CDR06224.1 regulatory protein MerR [Streptomyces iranensis]
MRLAELSERSGVPTATIKYYLRERLLPPGERITATQAEYGEEHLRRLRLVRSLIQVGRMPVATAREVLAASEDESLSQNARMGAAIWALPHGPEPDEDDPHAARARAQVDAVLRRMDWSHGQELGDTSPAYRMLVAAIASLDRLGYPHDTEHLLVHARLAGELAVADLDLVETYDTPPERVEAVVALTVLYEPVLLSLRRLAQTEESGRRFEK